MTTRDHPPVTVLVVEDEDDQRLLLTLQLRRSGCTVLAAPDAEAVWPLLEGVEIDLAVLDLQLPGASGWALAAELHERRPACPIVVTSVLDVAYYPLGHHALPKPFTRAQLLAVLGALVPTWNPA